MLCTSAEKLRKISASISVAALLPALSAQKAESSQLPAIAAQQLNLSQAMIFVDKAKFRSFEASDQIDSLDPLLYKKKSKIPGLSILDVDKEAPIKEKLKAILKFMGLLVGSVGSIVASAIYIMNRREKNMPSRLKNETEKREKAKEKQERLKAFKAVNSSDWLDLNPTTDIKFIGEHVAFIKDKQLFYLIEKPAWEDLLAEHANLLNRPIEDPLIQSATLFSLKQHFKKINLSHDYFKDLVLKRLLDIKSLKLPITDSSFHICDKFIGKGIKEVNGYYILDIMPDYLRAELRADKLPELEENALSNYIDDNTIEQFFKIKLNKKLPVNVNELFLETAIRPNLADDRSRPAHHLSRDYYSLVNTRLASMINVFIKEFNFDKNNKTLLSELKRNNENKKELDFYISNEGISIILHGVKFSYSEIINDSNARSDTAKKALLEISKLVAANQENIDQLSEIAAEVEQAIFGVSAVGEEREIMKKKVNSQIWICGPTQPISCTCS